MTESAGSNKTLFKYLGFTFGIGYAIHIAATRLLGPAPNGLLAGIPFIIVGALIFWKNKGN